MFKRGSRFAQVIASVLIDAFKMGGFFRPISLGKQDKKPDAQIFYHYAVILTCTYICEADQSKQRNQSLKRYCSVDPILNLLMASRLTL